MRKPHALLLFAAGACLLPCHHAVAEIQYKEGEGWSVTDADGRQTIEASASAQLDKAEALEKAHDYHGAMLAYFNLTRKFPRSGAAADAQLKAGDMAVLAGDYDRAYTLYNQYVTKYPKGEDFDKAMEGIYDVGQKFLEGAKRKLLGVKTFPSMVRAQQIFEDIVKTAPYSKWAPLAQFYAGQALEKQGRPDEAITAYQEVISRYPTDQAAADAQYQIGYVYMVQSRTAYDKTAATKAQEAFEDFLARYPASEKSAQAQDNLKTLQTHENSNAVAIAKFYDKKKNFKAAVIYYNEVIKEQPGTPDAKMAEARIAEIKAKVGDTVLQAGTEKPETGAKAQETRRMQAQVDTAARPDYLGPPVTPPAPVVPDQTAPAKPQLRSSPSDMSPVPAVEPPLPKQ